MKRKGLKVLASIVLSTVLASPALMMANTPEALASSTLPMASTAVSGTGFTIDSSGDLTIDAGSTVDMNTIVQAEWGQNYNHTLPPLFNQVTVDGTLTTTSSYELAFDANSVVVDSGGTISMTGQSTGSVASENGNGNGGGGGVLGNGGNGGNGGAGGTGGASGAEMGGTGGGGDGGAGGGYIDLFVYGTVNVEGSIQSNGEPGGNLNGVGQGGGGGGLVQIQALGGVQNASNVTANGGGGGSGGNGSGGSETVSGTTYTVAGGTGGTGQSGSDSTGGEGGGGGGGGAYGIPGVLGTNTSEDGDSTTYSGTGPISQAGANGGVGTAGTGGSVESTYEDESCNTYSGCFTSIQDNNATGGNGGWQSAGQSGNQSGSYEDWASSGSSSSSGSGGGNWIYGGGGGSGGNGGNGGTAGNTGGSAGQVGFAGGTGTNSSGTNTIAQSGQAGGGGGGAGEVSIQTGDVLNSISINDGAMYSLSKVCNVTVNGVSSSPSLSLVIGEDPNLSSNVESYTVQGTPEPSASNPIYYSYTNSVSYTLNGIINQQINVYAKLGNSNVASSSTVVYLDTTPPTVSVSLDAGQTSTTTLPIQVSVLANDPVAAQGMEMLYSPDGQTWYNVVTKPLSSTTTDVNGNTISPALVSATANASTTNPVFVQAQSATDVQPYSTYTTGFSIPASPVTVNESGTTVSNNIWTMDSSVSPSVIKSGEEFAYVLVQDANANQGSAASAIYYEDNSDTPSNPNLGIATTGSGTIPAGLISSGGSLLDASGNPVAISGGSWSDIGDGSTTTTVNGQTLTMNYTNGVPNSPIGLNGEVVDLNGQPTIVSNVDTLPIDVPVSSSTTEFQLSTNNGEDPTSWQSVSNGAVDTSATLDHDGLDAVSILLGNGQTESNWTPFPVLIDTSKPSVSIKQALGGGGVSVGSTDQIAVNVQEGLGNIPLFYAVSINGGSASAWKLLTASGSSADTDVIPVTIPNQGVNEVTVTVADLAGNQSSDTMSVLGL